jgi:hypothetical protein
VDGTAWISKVTRDTAIKVPKAKRQVNGTKGNGHEEEKMHLDLGSYAKVASIINTRKK